VLLKGWEKQIMFRANNDGSSGDQHKHPFTGLPALKCHIRPQFAIYNAGLKLTRLSLEDHKQLTCCFPALIFVMDLYYAWNWVLPAHHTEDQSYKPPGPSHDMADDSGDDDDDYVDLVDDEEEDLNYEDQTKRKRKGAQEVPRKQPKWKREQKVSALSQHQLYSKITLSRLEQLGQAGWTCKNIRKWADSPRIQRRSSKKCSSRKACSYPEF
jgi:hypothetical protein